jgi:hypothetical protein
MPVRGARPYSTPADILEYQSQARSRAESLTVSQLPDVNSTASIHVREAFANEDLNANTNTATSAIVNVDAPVWETNEQATVDDDTGWYGWYSVDSDAQADDKGVVVWGFEFLNEDEDTSLPFSALRVKNNTGGLIDLIDISDLDVADNGRILYDNPLELGTKDAYFEIYQNSDPADGTNESYGVKPLVAVGEEEGSTLEDSGRFIRS